MYIYIYIYGRPPPRPTSSFFSLYVLSISPRRNAHGQKQAVFASTKRKFRRNWKPDVSPRRKAFSNKTARFRLDETHFLIGRNVGCKNLISVPCLESHCFVEAEMHFKKQHFRFDEENLSTHGEVFVFATTPTTPTPTPPITSSSSSSSSSNSSSRSRSRSRSRSSRSSSSSSSSSSR